MALKRRRHVYRNPSRDPVSLRRYQNAQGRQMRRERLVECSVRVGLPPSKDVKSTIEAWLDWLDVFDVEVDALHDVVWPPRKAKKKAAKK